MSELPALGATTRFDGAKLEKIVSVLMEQVERGIDFQGNAYSLFQTAIVLEDRVRERTRRLETALRELEKSNRALSIAKQQTETAQNRLMEAIESISEGFVQFDRDDRLILCNTKFLEFWASPHADIRELMRPGVPFRDISRWTVEQGLIVDAETDPAEWLRLRLFLHGNPSEPLVVQLASGRWLQIRERHTRDGGTVGIYTDITELKLGEQRRREQELAEKSMLLQSTLDNLVQGVSVFDRDLRLVAWNDRFAELLDLPDWLVRAGAGYYDYLRYRSARGDYGCEPETAIAKRLEQIRRREPGKSEQVLANGTVLEVRRDPMPGGGFVVSFADVTERQIAASALREAKAGLERRVAERTAELTQLNEKLRQEIFERAAAEDALRRAKADAERANLGKTRFLAAASHDLLQPLNAARLFVTSLCERPMGEPERALAQNIDRALGTVEALLATLLDISKLDAGAVRPERTDFVVGDLLSGLAEEFAPLAAKAGLDIRVARSSHVVRTDPALLSRVLRNLLANAVRYTPKGRILLGCRRRGWMVRIEVWDTGVGIPAENVREIFEEFRQLGPRERAGRRGFGLGLAIVERIARVLEHPLGVRSTPGRGSVFFIDVPVGALARALPPREPAVVVPLDRLDGALAVVIDDQDDILDGMQALLSGWGCRALTAVDGRTSLIELARRGRAPDVVIADYHLEDGRSGLSAVDEVRALWGRDIPAVIITADGSPAVAEAVRRRGLHLLRKPLKPAKLRALMSHLLGPRTDIRSTCARSSCTRAGRAHPRRLTPVRD